MPGREGLLLAEMQGVTVRRELRHCNFVLIIFSQFFRIDCSNIFKQGNQGVSFFKDIAYAICCKLIAFMSAKKFTWWFDIIALRCKEVWMCGWSDDHCIP